MQLFILMIPALLLGFWMGWQTRKDLEMENTNDRPACDNLIEKLSKKIQPKETPKGCSLYGTQRVIHGLTGRRTNTIDLIASEIELLLWEQEELEKNGEYEVVPGSTKIIIKISENYPEPSYQRIDPCVVGITFYAKPKRKEHKLDRFRHSMG